MESETNTPQHVVILPGLSDGVRQLKFATNWWRRKGLEPHVLRVGWRDGGKLEPKLDTITDFIEALAKQGRVSIVGTSAGGSMALNLLIRRPDIIGKAVSICGRLRSGPHKWRALDRMSATSESFRHSVLLLEESEPNITRELRLRIMTVSARFGDQLVPADTSFLEDAYNIQIPTGEHITSIFMSLTLFAKPVIDFIRLENEL